jgi:hypothetical protein
MEAVARALELPRERAQERLKEIDARLREPAITADERAALVSEQAALHDAQRPGAVPAVAAYRSLSAVRAHQLRTTGEVRLSSADGSLPPPLAEQIHAAFAQMRSSGEVLAIRVGPGGPPAGADEDLPPVQADAIIRLSDSGPALRMAPVDIPRPGGGGGRFLGLPASSRRRLRLDFTLNSVRGRDGDRRVLPVIWMPTDPQHEAQSPAPPTEDADLKKEVDLAIPVPPPPAAAPGAPAGLRITILGQGNARPGLIPLSRVAEALHRATGLEVLCDSFVRARVEPARVNGRRSVVQVLDAIAQDLDYRWETEGGAIRLRSGLYYEDRPSEVPERILRPWRGRVAQKGAPHLDDLAELAAALEDSRLRGMQDFWGWYLEGTGIEAPRGAAGLYGTRYHLRYWASLSRPQRQAVLAGNALPVAQMTGQQRQAFLLALASPAEPPFIQNTLPRAPNAAEVAAGAFSLRQQETKQQAYTSDGADGQRAVAIIGGGPGGPNPPPPPRLPDGRELQPAGPPTTLDGYMFMYFLAGEERPARTMLLNVPRPSRS